MRKASAWFLIVALSVFMSSQAKAHSFNVALVIPLSGPFSADGKTFREGFMLATKERDGHPDEESDGHLGGLDVYLHTADIHDARLAGLKSLLKKRAIDIIVPTGSNRSIDETILSFVGGDSVLLTPGRVQLPDSTQPGIPERSSKVTAFNSAFEKEYGYQPSASAAHGYNAARRIDAAVRSLGGVADKPLLQSVLKQSENRVDW